MKQKIFFSSLCMVFISLTFGFSQETPPPYRLDDIIITASRIETPLIEAPANITVITKANIEEMGAKTVLEALKGEPGIFTTSMMNNPKSASVDIRGYGETAPQNVLFLVNGRRLNDIDMSRTDLSHIPVDMIERIEIYRGPASVLFGDNAISGVINIILKQGKGKPRIRTGITAGSYDLYNPFLDVSGKEGKFSYYLLTSAFDTSGYRHNNTLQNKDINGHFSFDILRNLTLNIKTGHHRDRYTLPGALSYQDLKGGLYDRKDSKTPFDNSSTEDNFIDIGTDIKLENEVTISVNGAYRNRHSTSHLEGTWGTWDSMRSFQTFAFTPKISVSKEILGIKNVLVSGFDYYTYPTKSNDSGTFTSSTTIIDKKDYGLYLNDEIHPFRNLIVNVGYRIHKATYDFDYIDNTGFIAPVKGTVHDEKEAFRAAVNYMFSKQGNIFLTYGKGFRLPATDEYFNVFGVPPINRNLKTQVAEEVDLGLRWNPYKTIGGHITLFQTKSTNEIFYNPLTFSNENYDRTKREGVETGLSIILRKDLKLDVAYSYIKANFDGGMFDSNDVPLVPRNKFTTKLAFMHNDFTIHIFTSYIGNRYMISDQRNVFKKLPGVTTIDTNIEYKYKGFGAFFGIKNLTGKKYSEYGVVNNLTSTMNVYPSAERQFIFGLEYTLGE